MPPVAIVTGTSTGIGLATSVTLARAGYDVYATMRNPARAPDLSHIAATEKLPIKILPMDVDDDASVSQTIGQILLSAARVNVLVNNAGVQGSGPIEEVPLAEFRRAMETNYFGVLRCIQAVLPGMRERSDGHIVNVSTVGGRIAGLSQAPYCGSASFVADKIVEVVQSKTWKLRHPTGPDAEPFLKYRASIADEDWINLHAIESDKEFAAAIKRDFGLDLDL